MGGRWGEAGSWGNTWTEAGQCRGWTEGLDGKVSGRQNLWAGLTLCLLVAVGTAWGPRGSEDLSMHPAGKHHHWFPWRLKFPGSLLMGLWLPPSQNKSILCGLETKCIPDHPSRRGLPPLPGPLPWESGGRDCSLSWSRNRLWP